MTKSPDQIGIIEASVDESLPVGFDNMGIYREYCNLLREIIVAQAADEHPSWERTGDRTYKRRGRTGPRTVEALIAWFVKTHPERIENLAEAIRRAVHVKHGIKPPNVS